MKILHIISYFQPEKNYEESLTAKYQSINGHEVHVLTSNLMAPFAGLSKENRLRNDSGYENVHVHRLSTLELYTDFVILWGCLSKIKKINPDIIHAHTTVQYSVLIAWVANKLFSIPYVIDCHDFAFKGSILNPISWNFRTILRFLEFRMVRKKFIKLALNSAKKIISVAPVCTEFLRSEFRVADNKISTLFLAVESTNSNIQSKFRSDNIRFLYTGIYSERKQIPRYIELFRLLPESYSLSLFLMLDSYTEKNLQNRIDSEGLSERVTIFSNKSQMEIENAYLNHDFGIWLFNNSISFLQAMDKGLPVIIGKMQLSYLINEDHGYIIENISIPETAEKIKNIVSNKEEIFLKSIIGMNHVKENLSYEKYVEELQIIYCS